MLTPGVHVFLLDQQTGDTIDGGDTNDGEEYLIFLVILSLLFINLRPVFKLNFYLELNNNFLFQINFGDYCQCDKIMSHNFDTKCSKLKNMLEVNYRL